MHEAHMHESSCFLTLTYDDIHLPHHGQLVYRDFQLFLKRLRKRAGTLRFYMCGEYGEATWRPHFHSCLFGVSFPDRVHYKDSSSGFPLYTSVLLSSVWGKGLATFGDLTFESAAYVARYCTKVISGDPAEDHYSRLDPDTGEIFSLVPEFGHMSLKPGIGATFLEQFKGDVFPRDHCVVNGMKMPTPKYYRKLLAVRDPVMSDDVAAARAAKEFTPDDSYERLRVRERVSKARLSLKMRSLR